MFLPSEILQTGGCSAMPSTPMWRASPGKLHKPLLESIWHTIKKRLWKFFRHYALTAIPRKVGRDWTTSRNPFMNVFRLVYYNNTVIRCVCVCVCVSLFVSLFVPSEISWTGRRSAVPLTLTWGASPAELHKPLLESMRCTVKEKKRLWKFFPRSDTLTVVYPRENFRLCWAQSILPTKF